jgi:transcriptional regulator with XRE-family HTH domain
MKITPQLTDPSILQELGARLTTARLERNFTQAALAERAGVSKRTVERLESGEVATQLSGFLRVCRVLGLIERLDAFVPETVPGPMAQLQMKGRRRQRASRVKTVAEPPAKWSWGEKS